MVKYKALLGEKFDKSKVTVVGSPTITSDGVASGFTLNDYIKKEQTLDLSKPFEIKTKIKIFTLDSQQAIFSFDNTGWNNYLVIHTNRIVFWLCFNNVDVITLKIETPLQNNKEYYIDFSWNGNVYKLRVSEDGETWEETSYNSSEVLYGYSSISKVIFGRLATYNYYPFTGSIDLKQFSITVDGQLVFQPVKPTYLLERRKEGFDLSKFTVVGTPSITEYGVASGFSSSDYIQTTSQNIGGSNFSITQRAKINSLSREGHILRFTNNTTAFGGSFYLHKTGNFTLSLIGINDYIVNNVSTTYAVTAGNEYDLRLVKHSNNYSFQIKNINDAVWTTLVSQDSSDLYKFNTDIVCQINNGGVDVDIDLPQFSTTVDGIEVFTGAKENYYMLSV